MDKVWNIKQSAWERKKQELKSSNVTKREMAAFKKAYARTTELLLTGIKEGHFIDDDGLSQWIDDVYSKLVATNPTLPDSSVILIKRNPFVNASSFIQGTIIINLGALARIEEESQLAFLLAHEAAHLQLQHQEKHVITSIGKKSKKPLTASCTDPIFEFQADSLANHIMSRAGYSYVSTLSAFNLMEEAFTPKYPLQKKLFEHFIFKDYPFKKRWLEPKAVKASGKSISPLIFVRDSLSTHQHLEHRKSRVKELSSTTSTPVGIGNLSILTTIAAFEAVESACHVNHYDFAMHLALQLKSKYPTNEYLNFFIAKIFYELSLAKNTGELIHYIPNYTETYSNETRAMNNFLRNLTADELSELGYRFMKKEENWNLENADHHRVLYKLCDQTGRFQEKKELKATFKKYFPSLPIDRFSHQAHYAKKTGMLPD